MNRRNFLVVGSAATASLALGFSWLKKFRSNIVLGTASDHLDFCVDALGDGSDLIHIPTFPLEDKEREYAKFVEVIKEDGLHPCTIWMIDLPKRKKTLMAAVSKVQWPKAKLYYKGSGTLTVLRDEEFNESSRYT